MREQEFKIPVIEGNKSLLHYLAHYFEDKLNQTETPLRFAITKSDNHSYHCEVGSLSEESYSGKKLNSIFQFNKRTIENTENFNAVLVVPTGVGAQVGGHAGDAGPVSIAMASMCDNLITHPNVVNASDINEMSENTLYVEGSVLSRLLMGTVGLQKVRSNRILMVVDDHENEIFVNAVINSVNGARATYGLDCPEIVKLNPPIRMKAVYSDSGRATGEIEGLSNLFTLLDEYKGKFDAIALSSVIDVPLHYHTDYFKSEGEMLNPWGGVEALLTHSISHIYDLPSAHSPMFENEEIANMDPGVVDPRMAAEAVSMTFLQCILKGLQRSPKIITETNDFNTPGVISAKDISCLIIPDGCIGLPTLGALEQGIPVIAIKDPENVMQNDFNALPWAPNQLHYANNYFEAMGIMATIKAGMTLDSIKRPIGFTKTVTRNFTTDKVENTSYIENKEKVKAVK